MSARPDYPRMIAFAVPQLSAFALAAGPIFRLTVAVWEEPIRLDRMLGIFLGSVAVGILTLPGYLYFAALWPRAREVGTALRWWLRICLVAGCGACLGGAWSTIPIIVPSIPAVLGAILCLVLLAAFEFGGRNEAAVEGGEGSAGGAPT